MTTEHAHGRQPFTDRHSRTAIDDAAAALCADRADEWAGDLSVEIHVLTSLRLQIDAALRSAVSAARQADYHWQDLAELLGVTTEQARRYYDTPPTDPTHHQP